MKTLLQLLVRLVKQHKSLLIFLTVGGLTAVVYFSLFTFLWKWCHLDYKLAVTMAYFISVTLQFVTHRHVTFKRRDENIFYQAFKFCGLLVVNYLLTILIVTWSVNTLAVSPYVGIMISVMGTVITGFLMSRLWVFKAVNPKMG
jgi:putative flippase GtrA